MAQGASPSGSSPSESPRPAPRASSRTPKLLDRFRRELRVRGYSPRTAETYEHWLRRFLSFHHMRPPREMGAEEVSAFLSHLATDEGVAAASQNQALAALLFLYKKVLGQELPWMDEVVRAKRPAHLPVVLSRPEVEAVLSALQGPPGPMPALVAALLYGAGLRLLEALALRIKDLDFDRHQILVRRAKGNRDRSALLPASLAPRLARHLEDVRTQHTADLEAGYGPAAEDVAETMRQAIKAGAAGLNLEDSSHDPDQPMFETGRAAERVAAARAAADGAGVPVVINARTDGYILGFERNDALFADAVDRANAYRAAGADCIFVPAVTDPYSCVMV